MKIQLTRERVQGNALTGKIVLPFETPLTYETLENVEFLIPAGTYPLKMTWSPKFRKMMPEICDVPDREGIRIHLGTKPEHSEGCILVNNEALTNLKIFIEQFEKWNDNDELEIEIKELS